MTAQTANWTKFWDLIKDTKYGMFTARCANGRLHSRPMTTLNGDEERGDVLWFFMSKNSEPAMDIARNADVNVAYGNPETDTYVSVSGAARLVEDMAKKKAFWSPVAQAWFGVGVNDPEVALVAVTIEQAEYWDAHENRATKLYEMTKAAMSGGRPDIGEHREMRTR